MTTGKIIETIVILGGLLIAIGMVAGVWQRTSTTKARATVTSEKEYRALAEEFRRLSEMSVTAQEHTDLKLADLGGRLDQMRDQLDQVQRILKDVE
jgi:uncharacterized protein HemX